MYIELPLADWPEISSSDSRIYFEGFFSTKTDFGFAPPMRWTPEEPNFFDCGCVANEFDIIFECYNEPEECDFRRGFL